MLYYRPETTMYRLYKPADSDITYAIKLGSNGAHIFDGSAGRRTFIDGDFETIHQALGVYLLRQMKVNDAWGELTMGIFD